jgi:hypothetical protein
MDANKHKYKHLRNSGTYTPVYMASFPRRLIFSTAVRASDHTQFFSKFGKDEEITKVDQLVS